MWVALFSVLFKFTVTLSYLVGITNTSSESSRAGLRRVRRVRESSRAARVATSSRSNYYARVRETRTRGCHLVQFLVPADRRLRRVRESSPTDTQVFVRVRESSRRTREVHSLKFLPKKDARVFACQLFFTARYFAQDRNRAITDRIARSTAHRPSQRHTSKSAC